MASFSIDIGDAGSSYEQGVAMPSATEGKAIAQGLSNLSSNIFGALENVAEDMQRGQTTTESERKRQAYASLIEHIDTARGVEGPQVTVIINEALSKYEREGYEVGNAEITAIKRRTGRDVSMIGVDPIREAENTAIGLLSENIGAVMVAKNRLEKAGNVNPTQEEVTEEALAIIIKDQTAKTFLATSKNISQQDFFNTYVPQAKTAIRTIRDIAVQGFEIEKAGGDISPESILRLRSDFVALKSLYTRPIQIDESTFKPIAEELQALDDYIKHLETFDQQMLDKLTKEALEVTSYAILELASGVTNPLLRNAILTQDAGLSIYIAENITTLLPAMNTIKNPENTVYTGLYSGNEENFKNSDGSVVSKGILHSEEDLDVGLEISSKERKDVIKTVLGTQVHLVNSESLNNPKHQDNFFAGIGKATSLMTTTQELFSTEQINELFNDELYEKLKFVKNLKPEEHGLAVERLKDVLQSQFNVYSSAAAGSLEGSSFIISGLGQVSYDLDKIPETDLRMKTGYRSYFVEDSPSISTRDFIKSLASKYYNGDVTALVADEGKRISSIERNKIHASDFSFKNAYKKYKEIQRISSGTKIYINNMKKLGMNTEAIEQTIIRPSQVEGEINGESRKRMFEEETTNISVFGSNIGIDEETYNKLPSGALYTVGNDATVRRKK